MQFQSIVNTGMTNSLQQFEQTTVPNDPGMGIQTDKELQEEIRSLGTGSFTTNTFNLKLQSSAGMKILKYIQSDEFGQHGESMALIDTINVSPALV